MNRVEGSVISNFLDNAECDYLVNLIDTCISEGVVSFNSDGDSRIFGFEKVIDNHDINEKLSKLLPFAEILYNKKIKNYTFMAAKLGPDSLSGSGNGWHRDSILSTQYKFIIYLSDVDSSSGPFQYIPDTSGFTFRLLSSLFNRLSTRFSKLRPSLLNKLVEITAPKGTLLIANTNAIHRGSPKVDKNRYAITLYSYHNSIPSSVKSLII